VKQVFVINNCGSLNNIAYCSKRIKEHLDANSVPYESITVMVTNTPKYVAAQETFRNIFGIRKALFYSEGHGFIVYHDIHQIENKTVVLLLDESTTTEVVKILMHKPAYEFNAKSIQLFTLSAPDDCKYIGEL
jgi:hypothetical protein